MKIDLQFYQHWEEWSVAKAKALATGGDVVKVVEFVRDITYVTDAFTKAVKDIPTKFPAILGWLLSNPDPLQPVRTQIYVMQKKWGV